ncbi:MAG: hypothetical protein AAF479_12520 [Pseudomonadota bacterium]
MRLGRMTLLAAVPLMALVMTAVAPTASANPWRAAVVADRVEDRLDRVEDRIDRRVTTGRRDRVEDRLDRRENRFDRRHGPRASRISSRAERRWNRRNGFGWWR